MPLGFSWRRRLVLRRESQHQRVLVFLSQHPHGQELCHLSLDLDPSSASCMPWAMEVGSPGAAQLWALRAGESGGGGPQSPVRAAVRGLCSLGPWHTVGASEVLAELGEWVRDGGLVAGEPELCAQGPAERGGPGDSGSGNVGG